MTGGRFKTSLDSGATLSDGSREVKSVRTNVGQMEIGAFFCKATEESGALSNDQS